MFAKAGPLWKSKVEVCMLNTVVPNTSLGIRSGVNCILLNFASTRRAISFARRVLATPGTPSIRTCPSHTKDASNKSTTCSWPTIVLEIALFSSAILFEKPVRSNLSLTVSLIFIMIIYLLFY